jgi:hypothetical protein
MQQVWSVPLIGAMARAFAVDPLPGDPRSI